jgi:hypothetical protein
MTSVSKLLVASALLVSFAAPAFASEINIESKASEERNVYTNAQTNAWTQADTGSQAYAMEMRNDRKSDVQTYANTSDLNNK